MADDSNSDSPLVELRGGKTAQALQNGAVNTAGQIGRDALNGAGRVASTAVDSVTNGDMENPFLFYMGAAGKTAGAAVEATVSTAANTAENLVKTGINTSAGLLGELTPAGPASNGGGRATGGRTGPR